VAVLASLLTFNFAPAGLSATLSGLVASNTAFGLNLYQEFAAAPGNVFFSPYSISTCLGMLYVGARGNTEGQMAQVLGVGSNEDFASLLGELQSEVESNPAPSAIQLNIANGLWDQQGYPFLPSFLEMVTNNFDASLNQADFETGAPAVEATINNWVSQETQGKIQNLFPPGSINAYTRLVLANAIYFKGSWATAFEASNTFTAPFYPSKATRVNVQMMHHPKLPARLARYNRLIARRRAAVETTFATFKRRMGLRFIRYIGLAKASGQMLLAAMAFNMRRWAAITG